MKAAIWTTREGEVIKVKKMTDSHICNVVRFFRKRAEMLRLKEALEMCRFGSAMSLSKHAADALDYEVATLAEMSHDEFLSQTVVGYEAVLDEGYRRKIIKDYK